MRPAHLANYADLFFRLLDLAVLVDPDTLQIRDVNDAFEKACDVTLDRAEGRKILEWVEEASRADFTKMCRVARRRYHPQAWEAVWRTPAARLLVTVNACMLKLSDGREMLQVQIRDITLEREAQNLLKELAVTDDLTQLANVRRFRAQIAAEHARAVRYGSGYSIAFFDIDHFKKYNDVHGHPAGSAMLCKVADVIRRNCRTSDLAVRYGGEEFVVLCPQTDAEGTRVFAERVRQEVEATLGITISAGIAVFPANGQRAEDVIEAADQALYHSKKSGRNRVTVASDLSGKGSESAA